MERYLQLHRRHRRGRRRRSDPARVSHQRQRAARRARSKTRLPGYRGMGPVRVGNDAWRQVQHDVYGSAILAATHVFFDERLTHRGDVALFERLEPLGRRAVAMHDQPDAGLWELRGSTRVHTFSSVMCWAACDRLARIADAARHSTERARRWRAEADRIRAFIDDALLERGARHLRREPWAAASSTRACCCWPSSASCPADDPRFVATVTAIERELKRGEFVFRYVEQDDFGAPANAFFVCTFWLVDALAGDRPPRRGARAVRRICSRCRNRHGLLAEHIDPRPASVGQLRADLQHGRAHQLGDPAVGAWDDAF